MNQLQRLAAGVRRDLLAPERVERMAQEMRVAYVERMLEIAARAEALPREIQELDARIMRLRERLKASDPDLTAVMSVALIRARSVTR